MAATKPDKLSAYRAKRSADRTSEPFGRVGKSGSRLFVIQHHAARALHYDLRLEMDGVLRSWAIPKGPSANPADKRLAVQVEDHPLEYADFEGRIPEGNYGAGASIIWDRGLWIPSGNPEKNIEKGKLLFELRGYKLRGKWTLVKTKRGPKDWLLIKEKDVWASEEGIAAYPADSVLSGLTVEALREGRDPAKRIVKKLKRLGVPQKRLSAKTVKVMLARAGASFSGRDWLFEIKYDGYRLIIARENGEAVLYSRAGNDLTATFPEIANAVRALPFHNLIMDGEAVVHDERGIPSFSRLQKRGRLIRHADVQRAAIELPATVYVFDLLAFDGYDLRQLPLKTRKLTLKMLLPSTGPIRYSDHIEEQGQMMYEQVRSMGLEGLVAKKADSRYHAGRTPQWIKIKVEQTDDFVVAGYSDPKGSQPGFGALLLAQYADGQLVYAGRVGTGFTSKTLNELGAKLQHAERASPLARGPRNRNIHWIKPELVCEIKFKETTPDGLLRQPVFLRLRDDKPAKQCKKINHELPEPGRVSGPTRAQQRVHLTNLDKVFWPTEGYTKGDLVAYYRAISQWLLPYLKDRPVVLTRYPDGIEGKSFFQKDAPEFVPDWIRIERMWSENTQREISYFIVQDLDSLLYIVNMASIPLHIWSSRMPTLERPDWCILDLDPKGAPFDAVVKIAKTIRALCNEIKLPCFVKTSGSTGLHVLIPLGRNYTYQESRSLGELLGRVVVSELPDIATVTRAVAQRRGRVYIDYLQNGHGRLLVAPFSVRPLPGATVSMPLTSRELTSKLDIHCFTMKNAVRRLRSLRRDPLRKILELKPDLHSALELLTRRFA